MLVMFHYFYMEKGWGRAGMRNELGVVNIHQNLQQIFKFSIYGVYKSILIKLIFHKI